MSTPQRIADFLAKWGPDGPGYGLNERQGAQQHFGELCGVLDVPGAHGRSTRLWRSTLAWCSRGTLGRAGAMTPSAARVFPSW